MPAGLRIEEPGLGLEFRIKIPYRTEIPNLRILFYALIWSTSCSSYSVSASYSPVPGLD